MQFTDKHKALLITFLISCSVVMAMFAFHLKKQTFSAETYYELEPEDPITKEQVEELEQQLEELKAGEKAETNQAFNETKQSNRFAQAYKTIEPPKDYEYKASENASDYALNEQKELYDKSKTINQEELERFNKANDILKQKLNKDNNNARSTMSYSLKDRELLNNPTPIYLCEEGGKIVVTIQVNGKGEVVDAYVNTASSSNNDCLEDNAIAYAMKAVFSVDSSKENQIGTITFVFQGKN